MRSLAGFSAIPLICAALLTPAAAAFNVPAELAGWEEWVLKDQEFRRCPFFAMTSPDDPGAHRCAWPEPLTLAQDCDPPARGSAGPLTRSLAARQRLP